MGVSRKAQHHGCGENIPTIIALLLKWGSTPHVRGNLREIKHDDPQRGLNPTCAGKPLPDKA